MSMDYKQRDFSGIPRDADTGGQLGEMAVGGSLKDPFRYLRRRSFGEILEALVGGLIVGGVFGIVAGGLITATVNAIFSLEFDRVFPWSWGASGVAIGVYGFLNHHKPSKTESELQRIIRQQEELFNRLSAAEGGSMGAIDQARTTLIVRANDVKQDQERIWERSRVSFLLGCVFLVTALGGPLSAIWLVVKSQDWRFYLAGMSVAIVMLAAAAAIFRHERALREQYRLSSDEIAYFNRLQVALDCSRAISDDAYKKTLRQIIGFLVTPGPALSTASKILEMEKDGGSDGPLELVNKVVDVSTELAKAAVTNVRK